MKTNINDFKESAAQFQKHLREATRRCRSDFTKLMLYSHNCKDGRIKDSRKEVHGEGKQKGKTVRGRVLKVDTVHNNDVQAALQIKELATTAHHYKMDWRNLQTEYRGKSWSIPSREKEYWSTKAMMMKFKTGSNVYIWKGRQ